MLISLAAQTVVVTGGARRLGRAIALQCARAGADVVITYRNSHDEAEQTAAMICRNVWRPMERFAALYSGCIEQNSDIVKFVGETLKAEFGGATAVG